MYDAGQLATAMLAIAFAAGMLVTGQMFVDYRIQHEAMVQIATVATQPP